MCLSIHGKRREKECIRQFANASGNKPNRLYLRHPSPVACVFLIIRFHVFESQAAGCPAPL
jgi:hypothetical protein